MTCRIWAIQGTWVGVSTWSGQRDRGETMEPVAPEECQVGSPAHSKIQGLPYQVRCPWRIRSQFQYSRIYEHLFRFDCWSSSIFIDLHRSSVQVQRGDARRICSALLSRSSRLNQSWKLTSTMGWRASRFAGWASHLELPGHTMTHRNTYHHIPIPPRLQDMLPENAQHAGAFNMNKDLTVAVAGPWYLKDSSFNKGV